MSSKKRRKKLKDFYLKSDQNIDELLLKIKNFTVRFPEIKSSSIKLGKLFQATIKIGNDEVQKDRLVYATIIMPMEYNGNILRDLHRLGIHKKNRILTATKAIIEPSVNPVLMVLYPFIGGGYAMHPITMFEWYGNEEIVITDIKECSSEISVHIKTPTILKQDMIWVGHYIGRKLDGVELFEESMA